MCFLLRLAFFYSILFSRLVHHSDTHWFWCSSVDLATYLLVIPIYLSYLTMSSANVENAQQEANSPHRRKRTTLKRVASKLFGRHKNNNNGNEEPTNTSSTTTSPTTSPPSTSPSTSPTTLHIMPVNGSSSSSSSSRSRRAASSSSSSSSRRQDIPPSRRLSLQSRQSILYSTKLSQCSFDLVYI